MSATAQKATAPTTADIVSAIRRLHTNHGLGDRWAFFEELRLGTGYGRGVEQRIDAFACGLWSKNWGSMAYEAKTTRADFRREIKEPSKRRMALRYSNLFWFVTPQGLIKPEELPIEAGLMEVRWRVVQTYPERIEGWGADTVVPAPWRDIPPPTWSLFASVARRVARIEANGAKP
jgi:hypothetical protein